MALPILEDTVQEGLENLLWQWRDSPNLRGLLESFLEQFDDLELAYYDLLTKRGVREAEGVQLDVLGDLVGEERAGRKDDRYRAAILSRGLINSSSGTPEEMLTILAENTGSPSVNLWEHFSGTTLMYADRGVTPTVSHAMQDASPAGTYTAVMFDIEEDSFIPSEIAFSDNILEVINAATEKDLEVLDSEASNYDLAVSDGVGEPSLRAFLPEINERKLGTQSILNPTLELDTDWTKGTGWTISSGATKSAGVASSLSQPVTFVNNTKYVIAFTVAGMTGGTLTPEFTGGTPVTGTTITANGSYEEVVQADSGNTGFSLNADSSFDGTVTNVSIFELELTPINPLCDILDSSVEILEAARIVTEAGDNVVDEFSNQILGL